MLVSPFIVAYLAHHPEVAARLRADRSAISATIEEILRIDAPLIANRRVTARPVTVAGVPLPTGARVTVQWASANRDERVFGDPDDPTHTSVSLEPERLSCCFRGSCGGSSSG